MGLKMWQEAWRNGIAPQLPTRGLEALHKALAEDDPALIQGTTVCSGPFRSEVINGCCPIAYAGWKALGFSTWAEANGFFESIRTGARSRAVMPETFARFLNFWDGTLRDVARPQLLAEVDLVLKERHEELAKRALTS